MVMLATDPISQFKVHPLAELRIGSLDLSFTNASFSMFIGVGCILLFFTLATSKLTLKPGRLQSMAEIVYTFIADMVRSTTGTEGLRFFPFVFSLFMFVLAANLLGMFPVFFTVTSQLIVTFSLSLTVMAVVIGYGLYKHGFGFFKIFVPSGVPIVLMPLVSVIEIFSFLSRPISLSVRLFANMFAGHTLLKVIAGFIVALGSAGIWAGLSPLPFIFTVALLALEFLVAVLQAYVFSILTCIYLNDALHPGH